MGSIRFTWDDAKGTSNRRKHGVSFDEARSVFFDDRALLIGDPGNSGQEDRFLLLGMSYKMRLLVVCHAYRRDDEEFRIISARRANRHEQRQYWSRL